MTIRQVLARHQNLEIDLLLSAALNQPREFLYLHPETKITKKQQSNLTKFITRRQKGEPIAYILGYKDFMGLRFKVNKSVLIPRPETEMIVDKVMSYKLPVIRKQKRIIRILDVGTGSGCVAISLAHKFKVKSAKSKVEIAASDISAAALKTAKENARAHHVRVKFVKSDLLKNIKGRFDIIVANLPYVPKEDFRFLIKDLRYEPTNAIFATEKGLSLIKKFLNQLVNSKILNPPARSRLKAPATAGKQSLILLEFDPRQKTELKKLIKKYLPKAQVKFSKDFANRWRFAEIKVD